MMATKPYTIDDVISIIKSNYLDKTFSSSTRSKHTKTFDMLAAFCKDKGLYGITWADICQQVNDKKISAKIMLFFVIVILDLGIYENTHSEALYRLLPELKRFASQRSVAWDKVFCGDKIDSLYIGKNKSSSHDSKNSYYFIGYKNNYLLSCMGSILNRPRKTTRWLDGWFVTDFENSLGDFAAEIKSVNDFNEYTFWQQVNYHRNKFSNDKELLDSAIKGVVAFYRGLMLEYPDVDIFSSAHSMSAKLLANAQIIIILKKGYHVTSFNMNEDLEDYECVVFLLRDFDRFTTQMGKEGFVTIDLSKLKSPFYRKELWKYYLSSPSITVNVFAGQLGYMALGLEFLRKLKSQPNYPNPLPNYFSNQEAVLLKKYIYDMGGALGTKNNRIGAIRRFLQWEKDSKSGFTFDDMFFSYLIQYEEPSKTSGNAIPDEDLVAINKLLVEKSKTDSLALLILTMFHIVIQTEFRIGQICSLTTDCIHPTIKPNQYEVHSATKTTHGRKGKSVITEFTYRLLTQAISSTERLRAEAPSSDTNYIFLYRGNINTVRAITPQTFRNYLGDCCKELGIKRYTAADLRDTHMTKSFEYILRNGKSNAEMSVLTKHKYIDTSKSHYIEMELEKILEATYGIIIGNNALIDPDKNLVDTLPSEASGEDSVVEDGCGCCTADKCVVTSSLPCLVCKHFVTTVAHEKFFIRAIENVDILIGRAKTQHDKEDFTTIKRLYVLYLKAIYKRKEAEKQ